MKKPVVDYREFRFSRLNDPRFSHLKLLFGWVVYFSLYFLTESLIPAEACHVTHCRLDDLIPFNEWFLIPYVFWYLLIAVSLGYFALYNIDSFRRLQIFIIVTQITAMLIYILCPNRQDLRPEEFLRDNLLTRGVAFLYAIDTSTNVCPSLHVAYSVGIASVWLKEKDACILWKSFVAAVVVIICISIFFVKQHSVIDALAALPVCLLAECITYGKDYWLPRLRRTA